MSFLRGSEHYVWCTTSVLGKGATGSVYQGVDKLTGEPVAVKTFNQLSHMRPHDVQMREFEVLKKVNHENIVKLLAIEEEQDASTLLQKKGKVIVMELCTGGSLFNILDDPENTYGLKEEEFLLVLEHLSAGMKHLRDNSLVHRDLKPGNIMKFIAEDGSTIYKLTDFGAARELEEDQQFMSLYGTEEYLHPDMYERAVLRKPVGKTFGASVDLWSIGVTLYHVATGNLPFRPYGGRRNKETMYRITTEKSTGVISGTQLTEKGPIDWNRELPKNCQLSAGLKKLVTPILAGLLEANAQFIWSFDKFFTEVTKTLARKPVDVFYVNKLTCIRAYVRVEDKIDKLRELIYEQSDVSPSNQILFYKENSLTDELNDPTCGLNYPVTDIDHPVLLFSKENNNVSISADNGNIIFPTFLEQVSVESDATMAKNFCSVGHCCKRKVEKLSRSSRLSHECVRIFSKVIGKELKKLTIKCENAKQLLQMMRKLVDSIYRGQKCIDNLVGVQSDLIGSEFDDEFSNLQNQLSGSLSLAVSQLHQRFVTEKLLSREWDTSTRNIRCPAADKAPERVKTLVERLRESWQHLLRDRATRNMTFNDTQFHDLERVKMTETSRRIRKMAESEVQPTLLQLADCLADWYKLAQTTYLQTQILDKDVETIAKGFNDCALKYVESDETFHSSLANASKMVLMPRNGKTRMKYSNLNTVMNKVKDNDLLAQDVKTYINEMPELYKKLFSGGKVNGRIDDQFDV